jgi:secondary thiamine-phosphate synthase enzyme
MCEPFNSFLAELSKGLELKGASMTYSVHQETIEVQTPGRSTQNVTRLIQKAVSRSGIEKGHCLVFLQHTSASLMLCENADPDVCRDLETFFSDLVQDGDPRFVHTAEGPDDMSAHVRTVLTHNSLQIPVSNGRCALGTWQGVFLWEHRARAHRRTILVSVEGSRESKGGDTPEFIK